ncbi:MAG: hypothetical protein II046_04100 [Clostridiales bacterium]|nr:hypothetical protein [Clostridiales bacterium]
MLAILYLILCAVFGMCFVGLCVPDVRRLYIACSPAAKSITHIPNTLFTVPAGIVTGMMCVPFFNYYVTLGLTYIFNNGPLCMKLGVLITFAFFIWMILTCLVLINRKRIKREELRSAGSTMIEDYRSNIVDALFYGIVTILITATATFLMFYTYRINGTTLQSGFSTFSDLSPHTAMVSSFGKGFNFPTQYMHFSGDGIKYHFFFYFLAGMLEYLGLPIDYAINLPSIIAMVCALVLLGLLAVLISSRRIAFAVAPVLVFFRSSLNAFVHIKELMAEGNTLQQAVKAILEFNQWYKVTDYDDWGIWAINVYPNQRHLMLGVAVIIIMVIIFLPFVRRLGISLSRSEDFGDGVKTFAFSKNAWLTRSGDPLYPVSIAFLACVLVSIMPYFHGSCLIALLLVLFGMAIFSESRLLYLIVAVFAVGSSYAQTLAFSGGYSNVVSFKFAPGFILDKPSVADLAHYLYIVTGLTIILALVFAVTVLIVDIVRKKPVYRFLLFLCALNPMIFAFLFQVTLEKLANHKFIQVSLILLDVFVAALIANLFFIPLKIRKAAEAEAYDPSEDEEDEVDASSDDGDLAVTTISTGAGVRTPVLAAGSAFGEPLEEKKEDPLDIEAMDSHTGIDADISGLNGDSDTAPAKEKEEIKEEPVPAELLFGDEKKESEEETDEEADESSEETDPEESASEDTGSEDNSSDEDNKAEEEKASETEGSNDSEKSDDSEAKAGVEALAALFGEEINHSKDSEETSEEDKEESSEEKADDKKTDDSDDSDEAVMESTPEPAHASMRPGSIALNQVKFGEDEPDDEDDSNVLIQSSNEVVEVVEADELISKEELNPSELKHEPVKTKKEKGIPLAAWIALELAGCILAIALMVPLTATGISEWATYINLNKGYTSVNINSPVTKWIMENTDPSDVFLTPRWSMNRFILAGRPMYYGWPYYAWSAGHDTYTRETIYLWLVSGCDNDIEEFTRYCKERHIRYLIADSEFYNAEFDNGVTFNREFVEKNLTHVAYFAEEDTTIYRIY